MKKPYEAPKLFELGTVKELTRDYDYKCPGSGDIFSPAENRNQLEETPSGCSVDTT